MTLDTETGLNVNSVAMTQKAISYESIKDH